MSDTQAYPKTVLVIGSDLLPPYITMEAKLIGWLREELVGMFDFKVMSINVTKRYQRSSEMVSINGLARGPMTIRKLVFGFQLLWSYWRMLRMFNVSVVHLVWVGFDPLTRMMIRMAKRRGARVVVTVLNVYVPARRYEGADIFIFHSDGSRERMPGFAESGVRGVVVPPPVETGTFMKRSPPYFVFASGPRTRGQVKSRGVYLLFETMKRLQEVGSEIRLRFVGRWQDGASLLETLIREYELQNVDMSHEHVSDMRELVGGATGLIIPYVGDSTGDVPLSALEALGWGTPVVTTHRFQVGTETISPVVTFCDPDPGALMEAMLDIWKRGDISYRCHERVKGWAVREFTASYREVYDGHV